MHEVAIPASQYVFLTMIHFYRFFLFLVFALLIWGCANQQPPDGGPIDTTPPRIIAVYPDSNTLQYNDQQIRLEFEHYVDERSLEESIFISPYINDLEFGWSGTEVTITFAEKLRENTTYVMNIGTDVRDRFRNQYRMTSAYTLAFSTGNAIDRGAIEGHIFPVKDSDPLSGVMIFAYRLDGLNPDTLNPMFAKPDFITQTGKNGDFFLHHLPFSTYRIFAVRDEFRNLVYDKENDDYGVPSELIHISENDTLVSNVLMKLAKEDTTGPRLIKITPIDQNHIVADFSESINPASCTMKSIIIVDTLDRKQLISLDISPSPSGLSSFLIVTQNQDSNKVYQLRMQGITDSVGNSINMLANSLFFQGSSKIDSSRPQLASLSIKDSTKGTDIHPMIILTFSDAMVQSDSMNWINIFDQQRRQINSEKKWISRLQVSITPKKELVSLKWYTLSADFSGLKNWAGRFCRDSIRQWNFETLDLEDMSSVEGMVVDDYPVDTLGSLYVCAIPVDKKNINFQIINTEKNGKFTFPQIVEGKYTFQAFRDRNRNGKYDVGKPFPFIYSERQSLITDTLKVRARWPLEGVVIQMK